MTYSLFSIAVDHISSLLQKTINRHGLSQPVKAASILTVAQRWLDNKFTDHTPKAETFRNGTLTISCNNSVISHAMHQQIATLQEYLASHNHKVESIRTVRAK